MFNKALQIKSEWLVDLIKLKNNNSRIDVMNLFDILINNFSKLVGKEFKIYMSHISYQDDTPFTTPFYPDNLEIINKEFNDDIFYKYDDNHCEVVTRNKAIIKEVYEIIEKNLINLNRMQSLIFPSHWFFLVYLMFNENGQYMILREELRTNRVMIEGHLIYISPNNSITVAPLKIIYKQRFGYRLSSHKRSLPMRLEEIIRYLVSIYQGVLEISNNNDVNVHDNLNDIVGINKNVMYVLMCVAMRETVNRLKTDSFITFSISYNNEYDVFAGYNYLKNNGNKGVIEIINDLRNMIRGERMNFSKKLLLEDLHETNVKHEWTNTV